MAFGALFVKTYRVHAIFKKAVGQFKKIVSFPGDLPFFISVNILFFVINAPQFVKHKMFYSPPPRSIFHARITFILIFTCGNPVPEAKIN